LTYILNLTVFILKITFLIQNPAKIRFLEVLFLLDVYVTKAWLRLNCAVLFLCAVAFDQNM